MNAAQLLMEALDSDDLDPRVVEALPWLPFAYPGMDWESLILHAKVGNRQNSLAYIVELARQLAETKGDSDLIELFSKQLQVLDKSRLAIEDALCESSMTRAERKWLLTKQTEISKHWNLLTDLTLEQGNYAFV